MPLRIILAANLLALTLTGCASLELAQGLPSSETAVYSGHGAADASASRL
jgi:hypothetical protein